MADIFLSYSSLDREQVQVLVQALELHSFSVWWDRHIGLGTRFDTEIEKELDASRCVIVVWSQNSASSDWVRTEASDDYNRGILIPVQIDVSRIPLAFRSMQTADLASWDGDAHSTALQQVISGVQNIVGKLPQSPVSNRVTQK